MDSNYRMALSEVNEILKYTDYDIVKRIPNKFMIFISENMDKDYKFNVQEKVELFEQPIRNEAKTILAMIYKDYFCDDIERKELIDYDKMQRDIEEKMKYEKYNYDNLFKNKNTEIKKDNNNNIESVQSLALIEIKSKNFIKEIIEKIKSFFIKNNKKSKKTN